VPELVASAHGIVLEVGPAVGNQLDRFDKSRIDHIYGVEPNPAFVSPLLSKVEETGLQGKYTLILGLVENEQLLAEHGIKEETVDSIVCLQTLCSVNDPDQIARLLWKILKPGGVLIFWEHQRSHDFLTRLVQGIYSATLRNPRLICIGIWDPLWALALGGCHLNRPIGEIICKAGDWDLEVSKLEEVDAPALWARLQPRVEGRMVKRA
jgi:SAM-dependent methyltransferase